MPASPTYFGRSAIRDAHVPVFEKWQKGTRLSMALLDTRCAGFQNTEKNRLFIAVNRWTERHPKRSLTRH